MPQPPFPSRLQKIVETAQEIVAHPDQYSKEQIAQAIDALKEAGKDVSIAFQGNTKQVQEVTVTTPPVEEIGLGHLWTTTGEKPKEGLTAHNRKLLDLMKGKNPKAIVELAQESRLDQQMVLVELNHLRKLGLVKTADEIRPVPATPAKPATLPTQTVKA